MQTSGSCSGPRFVRVARDTPLAQLRRARRPDGVGQRRQIREETEAQPGARNRRPEKDRVGPVTRSRGRVLPRDPRNAVLGVGRMRPPEASAADESTCTGVQRLSECI